LPRRLALEVAAVGWPRVWRRSASPSLYAVYAGVQALAGAVIVWHYPRHPIGWLLAAFALVEALFSGAALSYGRRVRRGVARRDLRRGREPDLVGRQRPRDHPAVLLFPDGRYLARGWRWVPVVWFAGAALAIPGWALNPRLGRT
jgi:hypothetical protein